MTSGESGNGAYAAGERIESGFGAPWLRFEARCLGAGKVGAVVLKKTRMDLGKT